MRIRKGQITIIGILTIVITLMVFALTLPIQIEQVNVMLNSTNDTTTRLIYSAFILIEGIVILMGIIYCGSAVRESLRF